MPRTPLQTAIFESDLQQQVIAKRAGIHDTKLSKIVNGFREASDDEKKRLARVLKRTIDDLFPVDDEARAS